MAEQEQVTQILETCQAFLRNGHFKLYGGLHSKGYVNVRLALAYSEYATEIGRKIANQFLGDKIDVVVGFTIGGIVLAENVAKCLNQARPIAARIIDDDVKFPGNSEIQNGENVLIVDDVLRPPSGKPINQVLLHIRNKTKGNIIGVGVGVDRTTEVLSFKDEKIRTVKLARVEPKDDFQIWSADSCPLCKENIPLLDYSEVDTDPLTSLFWLRREKDRVFLAALLKRVVEKWWKEDEELLAEVKSLDQPASNFPGEKWKRVAILGATEAAGNFFMNTVAKFVARRLGFYAITSRFFYEEKTAGKRASISSKGEGMNEFLQRMIHSCQYAIVVHALAGGQFIETVWCGHCCKPTLGLIPIRNWSPAGPKPCEYLVHIPEKHIIICNGSKAVEEGKEEIGAWICQKNDTCPLVRSQNISKMIFELFMSGKRMFLVGCLIDENLKAYEEPVSNFLHNKGVLKYEGYL